MITLRGMPPPIIVTKADHQRLSDLASGVRRVPHVRDYLARELDRARVVDADRIAPTVVTMNSRVAFKDNRSGEERTATLVYPGEQSPTKGRLSILTPTGAALLGLSEGQSIEWETSNDEWASLTVLKLHFQPEAHNGAERQLGKQERQDRILAELRASPAIRVLDLAERFAVSTETVRRDLDELSRNELINRTYGGAVGAPLVTGQAFDERYRTKTNERIWIGRMASSLVAPGDVLMIDAGATTIHVARRLAADIRDLTVITTSFGVASALAATPATRVIVCPGDFDPREGGVVGPDTLAFLRRFHAAKAIIGASGLGADGPTEASSGSAWIKRVMIERSAQAILVIDQTKFGQTMFELVCPLAALDHLVADAAPNGSLRKSLAKANVTLHVAQES